MSGLSTVADKTLDVMNQRMSKKTPTELLTEIRLLKEQIEKLKMEAGEDAMEFRALQRKY